MPSVQIYIREEDYEKWKKIQKKSAFIHNALAKVPLPVTTEERNGVFIDGVFVDD